MRERLLGGHTHHVEAEREIAIVAHAEHGLRGVLEREAVGRGERERKPRMQEAAPAHIAFARVLAVRQAVDRGEVALFVAWHVARRGVLARVGAHGFQAIGRARV